MIFFIRRFLIVKIQIRKRKWSIISVTLFTALFLTLLIEGCSSNSVLTKKDGSVTTSEFAPMLPTTSYPLLQIKKVQILQDKSQPLQLILELIDKGKAPLALSQDQFSIHIFTQESPYLLTGNVAFSREVPEIIKLNPQETVALNCKAPGDRFRSACWGDLKPGLYTLRIYINSTKSRKFDYQWLGQTSSDDYQLEIK